MKYIMTFESLKDSLMKYIKTYEEVNDFETKPETTVKDGDYVIFVNENDAYSHINNKIGKVIRVRKVYGEIDIDFDKPIGRIYGLSLNSVKYWSPNKRDLEQILVSQNYNL